MINNPTVATCELVCIDPETDVSFVGVTSPYVETVRAWIEFFQNLGYEVIVQTNNPIHWDEILRLGDATTLEFMMRYADGGTCNGTSGDDDSGYDG